MFKLFRISILELLFFSNNNNKIRIEDKSCDGPYIETQKNEIVFKMLFNFIRNVLGYNQIKIPI